MYVHTEPDSLLWKTVGSPLWRAVVSRVQTSVTVIAGNPWMCRSVFSAWSHVLTVCLQQPTQNKMQLFPPSFSASLWAACLLLLLVKQQPTDRSNSRRGNSSSNTPSSSFSPPLQSPSLAGLLPLFLLFLSLCAVALSLSPLPLTDSPTDLSLSMLWCTPMKKTERETKRETFTPCVAPNHPKCSLLMQTLAHPIAHNHISVSLYPFIFRFSCVL